MVSYLSDLGLQAEPVLTATSQGGTAYNTSVTTTIVYTLTTAHNTAVFTDVVTNAVGPEGAGYFEQATENITVTVNGVLVPALEHVEVSRRAS